MRVLPMCDTTERHPATGCTVACRLERGHDGDHQSRDLRWTPVPAKPAAERETGRMNIAEFLTARLDEDEAAAKSLHVIDSRNWHTAEWYDGEFDKDHQTARADLRSSTGSITAHGALPRPVAEHVARWQPARVLAEIEAKRRIIARYAYRRSMQPEDGTAPNRWDDLTRHYWEVCRDLAAPYADHPDYQPEWTVS
jgi:hypothetical protein